MSESKKKIDLTKKTDGVKDRSNGVATFLYRASVYHLLDHRFMCPTNHFVRAAKGGLCDDEDGKSVMSDEEYSELKKLFGMIKRGMFKDKESLLVKDLISTIARNYPKEEAVTFISVILTMLPIPVEKELSIGQLVFLRECLAYRSYDDKAPEVMAKNTMKAYGMPMPGQFLFVDSSVKYMTMTESKPVAEFLYEAVRTNKLRKWWENPISTFLSSVEMSHGCNFSPICDAEYDKLVDDVQLFSQLFFRGEKVVVLADLIVNISSALPEENAIEAIDNILEVLEENKKRNYAEDVISDMAAALRITGDASKRSVPDDMFIVENVLKAQRKRKADSSVTNSKKGKK